MDCTCACDFEYLEIYQYSVHISIIFVHTLIHSDLATRTSTKYKYYIHWGQG